MRHFSEFLYLRQNFDLGFPNILWKKKFAFYRGCAINSPGKFPDLEIFQIWKCFPYSAMLGIIKLYEYLSLKYIFYYGSYNQWSHIKYIHYYFCGTNFHISELSVVFAKINFHTKYSNSSIWRLYLKVGHHIIF